MDYTTVTISRNAEILARITYTDKPTLRKVSKLKDPSEKELVRRIQRKRTTCTIHAIEFSEGVDKSLVMSTFYRHVKQLGFKTVTMFTTKTTKEEWMRNLDTPLFLDLYNLDLTLLYRPT